MPFVKRLTKNCAILLLLWGGLFLLAPHNAEALSNCGLSCSCTLSTSSITLSGYNPINNMTATGIGTVTVGCTLLVSLGSVLVPYTVSLSKGTSGSYGTRQLSGPSAPKLTYNLYSDALMTTIWGDGTGGSQLYSSSITVSVLNLLVPVALPVYALIPARQNVPLGTYTDTIVATLQF